jgi:hypothetical protein
VKRFVDFDQMRVLRLGSGANHGARCWIFRGAHDPRAGLDDGGFFGGNSLDGMAEEILVIERDLRDHGDFGLDDIGRVQASTHANFKDSEIDVRARKFIEGDGRDALEERGMRRERA